MFTPLLAQADNAVDAGKAIALALGVGLGSLGAGVGIGNIFGSMIQAVARQPELRGELQGIQWLGFALTEADVLYGLIGGLLALLLVLGRAGGRGRAKGRTLVTAISRIPSFA